MLDCDGNRHAEPGHNSYPSATVLFFRQEFVRDSGGGKPIRRKFWQSLRLSRIENRHTQGTGLAVQWPDCLAA